MDIISIIFFLLVAAILYVQKRYVIGDKQWVIPVGFIIKYISGIIFLYIYSENFGAQQLTADAGEFLREASILNGVFWQSPTAYFQFLFGLENNALILQYLSETSHWDTQSAFLLNDSKNVIRMHSLLYFISNGNTGIHLGAIALLGVFSTFLLTKALSKFSHIKKEYFFLAILCIPSVLFWTSGVLKEPFIFFGIATFLFAIFAAIPSSKKILYGCIALPFLIGFKPYIFVCLLGGIVIYFLFYYVKNWKTGILTTGIVIGVGIALLLTNFLQPVVLKLSNKQFDFIGISKGGKFVRNDSCFFIFSPDQFQYLEIKEKNKVFLKKKIEVEYVYPYQKSAPKLTMALPNEEPWQQTYQASHCGSYIDVTYIDKKPKQLLKNVDEALFNAIFRPLPGDPGSWLKILPFLEMFSIVGLLLFAIWKRRKISQKERALLAALTSFALLLYLLIGWTTPVLGAIVRYRYPAILAVVLVALILLRPVANFHQNKHPKHL